ncbi:MAG: hypothetical protein R2795_13160 [Saprospiraceae bacterium]
MNNLWISGSLFLTIRLQKINLSFFHHTNTPNNKRKRKKIYKKLLEEWINHECSKKLLLSNYRVEHLLVANVCIGKKMMQVIKNKTLLTAHNIFVAQ